ncbi:radical SAM protein [Commensalibacter sp. M0402]|uniref:radical SAM protein n=1 Tax=Commensalibacter TaxID=1079922 RepID=UPI0018DE0818|nr:MULTISPECIES: radical SAM protein [Commensalibacter]MBI0083273.1 radical SAM protein [Commensalibacter sp. W6292M3]MBI0088510.1 radical SAM protein [Commensalibacter melissae]
MYNISKKLLKKLKSLFTVHEPFIGFVDELSDSYAYGWVCNQDFPNQRLICEAILQKTNEILVSSVADKLHYETIKEIGDGSCYYAFYMKFPRVLSVKEHENVVIRVKNSNYKIPFASNIRLEFQPFVHMAMDIVNNCNLRCPFCLYDYTSTNKTYFMSEEVIESALRFLPYIRNSEFWFSCLHEPTLHPKLMDYIEKVPEIYRNKIFFTTNLAKRMSDHFFNWLVNSGIDHINISLESFDSVIYEQLRKGAKQHIFLENMEKLKKAVLTSVHPIRIQFIIMAYQSNLKELPDLFNRLVNDYNASKVEIRNTFDTPYLSKDFKEREFLNDSDWVNLRRLCKTLPNNDKLFFLQDLQVEEADQRKISVNRFVGQFMLRLSWDGRLKVFVEAYSNIQGKKVERNISETNIKDIVNIHDFYDQLIEISNNMIIKN